MRVGTLALTGHAAANGYAVPAVNVFDEFSLRGVVVAAERTQSPLIIQVSVKTVRMLTSSLITHLFDDVCGPSPMPFALHLDHCPDRAVLSDVIAAGWSSVLFDASGLGLDAATAQTAEVVAEAHAKGVAVESEIENIIGVEDGVGSDTSLHAYTSAQLAEIGDRTGVDLLAPQLGTAHGLYKASPMLRPDRVTELRALSDKGVVLHGGTGLARDEFRAFVDAGVVKINISTACKMAYLKAALAHLEEARAQDKWEPPAYFTAAESAVADEIATYPEIFGSAGHGPAIAGAAG